MFTTIRNIIHFLFPAKTYPGQERDYLIPKRELDSQDIIKEYQNPKLLDGLSPKPFLRLICGAGLSITEMVLTIEKTDDEYVLFYRERFKYPDNLPPYIDTHSDDLKYESPKEVEKKKNISEQLAFALQSVLVQMLEEGKEASKNDDNRCWIGPDGEIFFFSAHIDGEINTGYVWSPPEHSKTNELVSICFALLKITKEDELGDAEILARIEELKKRLLEPEYNLSVAWTKICEREKDYLKWQKKQK